MFNGASVIEGTMQSVLNQSFTNFEYIVIDGKSTDETLKIAEHLKAKHTILPPSGGLRGENTEGSQIRIFSEKDKGLYDAMNKGLRFATGDFVLFLNAGDHLFEPTTLAKLAAAATPTTDVLFGETMLVDDARRHIGTRSALTVQKLPTVLTWKSMRFGMVVCHQSFLVSRSIASSYDGASYIENNLAADIDWVINCLKKARTVTNANIIVSEYLMGGISKTRHQQSLRDRYAVLKKHFGALPNFFNHIYIVCRAVFFQLKIKN